MQLASRGSDACRPRETVRSPARGLPRERLEFEDVAERSVLIPSRRLDESRRRETWNDHLWISALPSSGHECIDLLRGASDVSPMNENLGQVRGAERSRAVRPRARRPSAEPRRLGLEARPTRRDGAWRARTRRSPTSRPTQGRAHVRIRSLPPTQPAQFEQSRSKRARPRSCSSRRPSFFRDRGESRDLGPPGSR